MDLMLLRNFQRQVQLQCQAVLVAAQGFNSAMTTGDTTRAWIEMQNLLNAAANISKALWGSKGRFTEQRAPLRETLQVDDSSPLREVAMRNHFEHYDERLDKWWAESERHNHFDMSMVSGPNAVVGLDDLDMFRVFDPSSGDVVFWGERFNINAVTQEAARLLPTATTEANKPHWDASSPPKPPSTPGGGQ